MVGLAAAQTAHTARIEVHSFDTVTLTDKQFLTGAKDGKPARIGGELRLPPGTGRFPAVILVHGSGGVGANVDLWAQELNGIGVAAFLLDSFTGRGIVQTITDQSQLGRLAMIVDAYRALELLSNHPRIDAARIAVMGFSKGGFVALYSSMRRFQRLYGPANVEFAAYIPFYGGCETHFSIWTGGTGTGSYGPNGCDPGSLGSPAFAIPDAEGTANSWADLAAGYYVYSGTGAINPTWGSGCSEPAILTAMAAFKTTSAPPTVATPTFTSATEGTVTITDSTSGASIYFCQDAANACTPTTSNQLYSGSFAPVFPYIRAFAVKTGDANSATGASGAVTAIAPSFSTQPTVAWTSPSSIAASFVTALPASVKGECGTTTGGPYTTEQTPQVYTAGWQRTSFTGTSTAWGNALAITGLHQNTTYYCVVVAYDVTGTDSTQSSEFSATTGTLSTTPVTVGAVSKLTRLNDQYNGANGMPNNGFWMQGDTEFSTYADDGNYYGSCHDCTGVGGAYSNSIGWLSWNSTHTVATQIGGSLGFGAKQAGTGGGWTADGGQWEILGTQSVRGQIYMPLWRSWATASGDANMLRSPDHLAHSISAGNQYAQGMGPNSVLATYADVPVEPSVMPNNPIQGSIDGGSTEGFLPEAGQIFSCQDESLNCVAQANNDGWLYSWCAYVTTNQNVILCRVRVEDKPLMDASKYQVYIGANSGDDGIYDSAWGTNPAAATHFGSYGEPYNGWDLGMSANSQFVPDFNRFLFLNTVDNTYGGSVVLYDSGPYPWGAQTAIGSVSWDNDQWPGFYPSFGQINPGSYVKTSSTPLGAIVQLTMTGTIYGLDSGTATVSGCGAGQDSCPNTSYSPFIGKLTLTPRLAVPARAQVSAVNRMDTHIASGLDLFYDFRGNTSLAASALPNRSPNDPLGTYSVATSGFSNVTTGVGSTPAAYFSQKGMYSFGFPPAWVFGFEYPQVVTTPYSKSLSAMTALIVFEHATSGNVWGGPFTNETPLAMGSSFTIFRNGTTANSWKVTVGSTTVGPFTLATDKSCATYNSNTTGPVTCTPSYVALVVRWDGTHITIYGSAQIPASGYTQPLTTLATGSYSGTLTGTLYLGATNGTCCTNPFYGTMSNLLIYSRALTDGELIHEMNALRADMLSRGVTLP